MGNVGRQVWETLKGPEDHQAWLWGQEPGEFYHPAGRLETWTPEQMGLQTQLSQYLGGTIGQPGRAYGGQMVAGLSPYEQMGLRGLSGMTMTPGAYMGDPATMGALQRISSGMYASPAGFMAGPGKQLLESWQEEIMPELRGEYGRKGLFLGTGRQRAEQESAESLMDVLTRGMVEYEQTGRAQQLQAIPTMLQAPAQLETQRLQNILGISGAQMQAGAVPRELEQAGLSAQYQEFLRTQPGATPEMGLLMQLLGMEPYDIYGQMAAMQPGTQGTMKQWGSSLLGGMGGAIMAA